MKAADAALVNGKLVSPGRCVHCGLKLDDAKPGRCPHCHLDQPRPGRCPVHDTKLSPIGTCQDCLNEKKKTSPPAIAWKNRAAAAAPPEPTPEPREEPVPAIETNGVHDAPAKAPRPCPTCGKPTHPTNGRCYECRPGGGAGVPRTRPVPADGETAPAARATRARAGDVTLDPEIAAMNQCLNALAGLDGEQLRRVLDYVTRRVEAV